MNLKFETTENQYTEKYRLKQEKAQHGTTPWSFIWTSPGPSSKHAPMPGWRIIAQTLSIA